MTSTCLPNADHRLFVTDGGIETDLIHHRGLDLPHFAAFPLLDTPEGRDALQRYYGSYVEIALACGAPLLLESPTWRANPDWATLLGYSLPDLARLNTAAIAMLRDIQAEMLRQGGESVISGSLGPRRDGYSSALRLGPEEAEEYHSPQLAAFAAAGADIATAYTITHVGEAVGIVRAARRVGLPVAVSFTVETDGMLPSGVKLSEAIADVDAEAAPDYFLINCAHPAHIRHALREPGAWQTRIVGTRANASTRSHAELDEATDFDDGDPIEFAAAQRELAALLPHLRIVGGCCGTDSRHIAAVFEPSGGS